MNERIREIRKYLSMNQTEFGERIGIKQTTVAGYETGIRTPLDSVVMSICKEFNINENWLRMGEGEMFNTLELDEYAAVAAQIDMNDPRAKQAIINYWKLSPSKKEAFWNFVDVFN